MIVWQNIYTHKKKKKKKTRTKHIHFLTLSLNLNLNLKDKNSNLWKATVNTNKYLKPSPPPRYVSVFWIRGVKKHFVREISNNKMAYSEKFKSDFHRAFGCRSRKIDFFHILHINGYW